jgi:hypothetical protein
VQRLTPHGHVRRDPLRDNQSSGVAFGVVGAPVGWQRNLNTRLHGGRAGSGAGQIDAQIGPPGRRDDDVIVQEHHPLRLAGTPAGVARRRRSLPGRSDKADRQLAVLLDRERSGRGPPVVHHVAIDKRRRLRGGGLREGYGQAVEKFLE